MKFGKRDISKEHSFSNILTLCTTCTTLGFEQVCSHKNALLFNNNFYFFFFTFPCWFSMSSHFLYWSLFRAIFLSASNSISLSFLYIVSVISSAFLSSRPLRSNFKHLFCFQFIIQPN